jgi:hypothetical protein
VADYLVRDHHFHKTAFADPLKEVCQSLFLLSDHQVHDPFEKEVVDPRWSRSPRSLLQWIGTDLIRTHLDKEFWVKHMDLRLESLTSDSRVVLSDVRFPNEADLVRRREGILIRIQDPHAPSTSHDDHASETSMEDYPVDIVIQNSKEAGLEEFYANCFQQFSFLWEKKEE